MGTFLSEPNGVYSAVLNWKHNLVLQECALLNSKLKEYVKDLWKHMLQHNSSRRLYNKKHLLYIKQYAHWLALFSNGCVFYCNQNARTNLQICLTAGNLNPIMHDHARPNQAADLQQTPDIPEIIAKSMFLHGRHIVPYCQRHNDSFSTEKVLVYWTHEIVKRIQHFNIISVHTVLWNEEERPPTCTDHSYWLSVAYTFNEQGRYASILFCVLAPRWWPSSSRCTDIRVTGCLIA